MDRDYPNRPFVGVGAVVWKEDAFLLVRRREEPRQGEWSLPGGTQHLGETLEQAAIREVFEETTLTVEIDGLIDVVDAIFRDAHGKVKNHYTLVDYAARWVSGEATAGDDATEVKWITLNELDNYGLWQETQRIILLSTKTTQDG